MYDNKFFDYMTAEAHRSAEALITALSPYIQPRSVVDVGCGEGAWLATFIKHGVTDVVGVDGSFVDTKRLTIPAEKFVPHDLSTPLNLDRQFELVVSLEVAEHLPAQAADMFVHTLVSLGPVILFSAAIPGQGGTNHINEQWPIYWADRFQKHNYVPVDCLRETLWVNPDISWYYAQNSLVYVDRTKLDDYPLLKAERERRHRPPLALVHPQLFSPLVNDKPKLRFLIRHAPAALARAIRHRCRR